MNNYIEKKATNYIKGIALIFMFIHHIFTFPNWYISGISYPYLLNFANCMRDSLWICVPTFAFLTGYFYFFSKNKTIRYSIKKSTDVWLTYVIIFLILLIPAILLGVYDFSIKTFVFEILTLKRPTMCFCWYVTFYIITMFILPLYAKLSEKAPCFCFLLVLVLPCFIVFLLNKICFIESKELLQIIRDLNNFQIVGTGFLFAKYGFFYEFKRIIRIKNKFLHITVSFLLIVFSMIMRYLNCINIVCAPFFIFGLMEIYYNINFKLIFKPISFLGKYSLIMWFLHCIFFNQCKGYTQYILYFPREPITVILWGLLICLSIAVVVQIPINSIIKIKNRIFKLNNT